MSNRKIFCIPGFGADDKIFSNLEIRGWELVFINWLVPEKKESLASYVSRMAAYIDDENAIIIGVSFGGMIALEIAKTRPVKQIFLISSVKNRSELPLHYKVIGGMQLNKLFPVKKIHRNEKFYTAANKRLGAITEEEKAFANTYRKNANLVYINWSFNQILNWSNQSFPENVIHIHGEADQIFPVKNIRPNYIIKGGTHMMVVNRAPEISEIINRHLEKLK